MIPKSNVGLKVGDTCFIPRDDGRHVPFVYVGKHSKGRAHIIGAFANLAVGAPQLEQLPSHIALGDPVLVHIKCYRENDTPIIGNVRDRLDGARLDRIIADIHNSGLGHVSRVWGWRTLVRKANDVAA